MDAFDIVTGEELAPVRPNSYQKQKDWRISAGNASVTILLSCEVDIKGICKLRLLNNMWETLKKRLDNTSTSIGRTLILHKFRASHLAKDETINTYFTRLIDYRRQLIRTPEVISDQTFNAHLFITIPKDFEITTKIFQHQNTAPTLQKIMDAIRSDEEEAALTEIADTFTRSALYS